MSFFMKWSLFNKIILTLNEKKKKKEKKEKKRRDLNSHHLKS